MNFRIGIAPLFVILALALSACTSAGGIHNGGFGDSAVHTCEDLPNNEQAKCMERSSVGYLDKDKYWDEFWTQQSSYD